MRAIDLFCGCGGLSLGIQRANITISAACDNNKDAVATYRANFDHPCHEVDLSSCLSVALDYSMVDMVIGSPPCQDFSGANKQDARGDRAQLTLNFSGIVAYISPKWFLMENVPLARKSEQYIFAKRRLSDEGYGLTEIVLNAANYGVPQNRRRLFLIGRKGARDGFLEERLLEGFNSQKTAITDWMGRIESGDCAYYRHPCSYKTRGVFSIYQPSPTIRGTNPPQSSTYKYHKNDAVTYPVARLTVKDRASIQTFPPDFKWVGSRTQIEKMLGNAVPVRLATFVGNVIRQYEEVH